MRKYQLHHNPIIDESYYTWKHPCGLTIIAIPKKRSATYAILGTRFGSIDNAFHSIDGTRSFSLPDGVAHFLEHKMFEGKDGTDAFERFAETGASANAYTSYDKTCFLFSCSDELNRNLEILLDFVYHPFFSAETIAKEQGIIQEEIAMYDDNPGWVAYYNLLNALYYQNPIRNNIVGTKESIAAITPELLYSCTDTFYNPHNMCLVVCGDIVPEQIDKICSDVLPDSSPEIIPMRIYPDEPVTVKQKRTETSLDIGQPILEIGFKDVPPASPSEEMRISAANAINAELLFSQSGNFFNRLYNDGLISSKFGGAYVLEKNTAFWSVNAICADPDALIAEVRAELESRKKNYFTEKEFETAKRVVYANGVFPFDSTEETANICMNYWIAESDYLDHATVLSKITFDEARQILQNTLRLENMSVSIVYPK